MIEKLVLEVQGGNFRLVSPCWLVMTGSVMLQLLSAPTPGRKKQKEFQDVCLGVAIALLCREAGMYSKISCTWSIKWSGAANRDYNLVHHKQTVTSAFQ